MVRHVGQGTVPSRRRTLSFVRVSFVCVGVGVSPQTIEREGMDRDNITLPGFQEVLIQEVAAASKGPLVVVYIGGGPTDLTVPKTVAAVHGLLWAGYPGQCGGQAIADVIFGTVSPGGTLPLAGLVGVGLVWGSVHAPWGRVLEACVGDGCLGGGAAECCAGTAPSETPFCSVPCAVRNLAAGRLPYTMYPGSFVHEVNMTDMGMRPNVTSGNPGHTYRFYTGVPVYPFGTGLR